jgi:hypothetical protein
MKINIIIAIIFIISCNAIAQKSNNLIGKTFQQIENISNSTTEIKLISNTQVVYVITNVINGKTYIDECPGKSTFINNKLTINCNCSDKEIYPDPIKDSFLYDSKSNTLTSTSFRSVDGKFFVWENK